MDFCFAAGGGLKPSCACQLKGANASFSYLALCFVLSAIAMVTYCSLYVPYVYCLCRFLIPITVIQQYLMHYSSIMSNNILMITSIIQIVDNYITMFCLNLSNEDISRLFGTV